MSSSDLPVSKSGNICLILDWSGKTQPSVGGTTWVYKLAGWASYVEPVNKQSSSIASPSLPVSRFQPWVPALASFSVECKQAEINLLLPKFLRVVVFITVSEGKIKSPHWPQTFDPPTSSSQALWLQVCTPTKNIFSYLSHVLMQKEACSYSSAYWMIFFFFADSPKNYIFSGCIAHHSLCIPWDSLSSTSITQVSLVHTLWNIYVYPQITWNLINMHIQVSMEMFWSFNIINGSNNHANTSLRCFHASTVVPTPRSCCLWLYSLGFI